MRAILQRSTLPIASFNLDDLTLIEANGATLGCLGYHDPAALPRSLDDLIVTTEEANARAALRLVADRVISAFEAHAHLRCADRTTFDARITYILPNSG